MAQSPPPCADAAAELDDHVDEFPPYIPSSRYDEAEVGCQWSHLSSSRRFWEYLILTATLITPIELSYVMIFDRSLSPGSYIPFFVLDALQLADNFVLLKTPVSEHGVLVTDPWKILARYGRAGFIAHCIASLPLGWIGVLLRNIDAYFWLSLARLLRLHRGYQAYRTIDHSSLYGGALNLLYPYCIIFAFAVHIFSCVAFLLAGLGDRNNSYITPFLDLPPFERYTATLYFVITAILTTGYGDIVPQTTAECMIVLAMEMLGVSLQAWLTAKMIDAISDMDGSDFRHRYRLIQNYLKRQRKVERVYSNHVRHFSQYVWETTHGAATWRELLAQVPDSIRNQIKLEVCERAIFGMELWRGMTSSERIQLMDYLVARTFVPEEVICTQNELVSDLFIFTSGVYRILRDGLVIGRQSVSKSVFDGERELIFREPRSKTLVAETFVDCWRLQRTSLLAMIRANPQLRRLLLSNARRKYPREFTGWNRRGDPFADDLDCSSVDVAIVYPSNIPNFESSGSGSGNQ
jgi:hypothetical protein